MTANRLFETIVDTTAALIIVLDAGGRIVLFNKACERLSGYRCEEVRGRLVWDFLLLPEEAAGVKATVENLRAGQFPNQHKNHWVSKSGELRLIEWSNSAVTDESGRVIQIIGTGIDVTEKRAAEREVREREMRFGSLVENLPLAFWIRDLPANRISYVSPAYETIWGRKLSDCDEAYHVFVQSIHPDDREMVFRNIQREIEAREATETEYRIIRADGTERWIHSSAIPIFDDAGQVRSIIGFADDITKRRRIEMELRETQLRQKALLDSIPDAAWLKDSAGRYVEVNQNWLARHNRERAEIIGKTDLEIFAGHSARKIISEDLQIMNNRQPFHTERNSLSCEDDVWLDVTKTPVLDEHGNVIGIAGVSRDITERKLAEHARLKRDAGLRAALVREVNHRIKNNLQSVMALLHLHAVSHPETALVIEKAVARLNAIATVHGLQAGSEHQEINLCNIVNALAVSMWGLHSGAPIEVQTSDDFVAVQVINSETVPIALIINELIQNAVKHGPAAGSGKPILIRLVRSGPAIRISISNPGAVLPAAFDYALGTGLGTGLNLLKSLMPQTGAEISFETAAPAGVTVTLTLEPPILMETDKPQGSGGATQHG